MNSLLLYFGIQHYLCVHFYHRLFLEGEKCKYILSRESCPQIVLYIKHLAFLNILIVNALILQQINASTPVMIICLKSDLFALVFDSFIHLLSLK